MERKNGVFLLRRGLDDTEDPNSQSQDDIYRHQVLQGARILEKTSQSIER